jgi:hypothetical protein
VILWFKVVFEEAILIRGLMSDKQWACLEPFVIERAAGGILEIIGLF